MSENLTVALSIQDRQALQSLKNVQQQVRGTSDAFRGLGKAIAALATGAFAASTLQMATAMTNLSRSTGIALDAVVGFGQAFTASGGSIDRAADGISDLVKNVGDAARGSKELQNAFGLVGVSLADLGTLSEQDILRKTIAGLAAMPDAARRTSTAMQILGESVKGVDLQQLNRELDGFTQRAGPSAAGIAAAAEAQRNFAIASQTLQTELLAALRPISELAVKLTTMSDNLRTIISAFIEFAKYAGIALLAVTGFGKLIVVIGALRTGVVALGGGFANLIRLVQVLFRGGETRKNLFKNLEELGGAGAKARVVFEALGGSVNKLKSAFPALAAVVAGAAGVINKFFGGSETYTRGKAQLEDYQKQQQKIQQQSERLVLVNAEEKKAIDATVRSMQTSSAEMLKRITLQTDLLRANEETRFAVESTAEAEQAYLKAIEPLLAKIQAIRDQGSKATASDVALLPTLEAGIARITKEYEAQVPALQAAINARIQEMQVAKELEIVSARLTKQAEDRAAVESSVRDIILGGQQRINDAYSEASTSLLPGIQGQLAKIAEEERRIGEAAKRRVAEQMGDDTSGLSQAIAEIDAAVSVIITRRQQAAQGIFDDQNSFVAGWTRAFNEYATVATNAATQAQNIFSTVTKGIEDAFVNFARTGKLSVKDLFKSIVETILRSQVQNLLARTFGGIGGGGGGSFLTSLFSAFVGGRSAGGPVSAGRAYRVGESGPETFVPTGGGTIVPGGGATAVTYNINAVDAASFQALVARDPEFLFAVTEQGRKRMPNSRR
jgi:lambda family phage tail tape measure protein